MLYAVEHLLCSGRDCWTQIQEEKDRIDGALIKMDEVRAYWHLVRFGGTTLAESPFSGFREVLAAGQARVAKVCKDKFAIFRGFEDARQCMPIDLEFVVIEPSVRAMLDPFRKEVWTDMRMDKDLLWVSLWKMMIQPIYENLFVPMFDSIINSISDSIAAKWASVTPIVVVLVVAAILLEIIDVVQLVMVERHIKSVLTLLLQVDPDVIAGNLKIMSILAGDFTVAKHDSGAHNALFFDTVFDSLPDALMYADATSRIIQGANKACRALFPERDISILSSVTDFYNSDNFRGDVASLWVPPPANAVLMRKVDGSEVYYDVNVTLSGDRLVIATQDITQTVRYNTLISEERAKSDQLLESILPPSLVKRVQAGEKNISFAVQSASISFMDIVEFTPWCGSLPAATVMSTLNNLFKRFDECVGKRSTLTKIKCIGDCYVCAGGIFSEINQPAVHAKEMVSFGLDAIQAIEELDVELDQKLRIRVGVNTGGPIVAGVLGIGKPTFEILGPTINMAQQMEHHGVPMLVHVSRAVYELIYGDASFQVKERGATQVNSGTVITYLVSPKK
jgi:class 3 adenylate cyclase